VEVARMDSPPLAARGYAAPSGRLSAGYAGLG